MKENLHGYIPGGDGVASVIDDYLNNLELDDSVSKRDNGIIAAACRRRFANQGFIFYSRVLIDMDTTRVYYSATPLAPVDKISLM